MTRVRISPLRARALPILAGLSAAGLTTLAAMQDAAAQAPQPARAAEPAGQATVAGDLLSYTVKLAIRVARADEAAKQAEQEARALGGKLLERRDGHLTVTVPLGQLELATRRLAGLGVELGRSVEVVNLSEDWIDANARLRSAEQARLRLWSMRRLAGEGVKDPIRLQQQIARVEDQTASLRASIHGLERRAADALIELRLQATEATETDPVPAFELPFAWLSRFGLDRLLNMTPTYEEPIPGEESYYLNDEGEVSIGVGFLRPEDPEKLGDTSMTIAGAMRVRGMFETDPVGPAIAMDLGLGAGVGGGALWEARMMSGPGLTIGRHFSMAAVIGLGGSGLTGSRIPAGLEFPVEVFAATDVTEYAQLRLWGRSTWLVASEARQNGAEHAPFGDELFSGASFVFGEDDDGEDRERIGLALGVTYGEMLGTRLWGLSLGYGGGFGDRRMNY